MSDLTGFLNARLDEEAAVAEGGDQASPDMTYRLDERLEWVSVTIARALAEVESKRRIIALHCVRSGTGGDWDTDPAALCNECGTPHPCETLDLLALPYATHLDYRRE